MKISRVKYSGFIFLFILAFFLLIVTEILLSGSESLISLRIISLINLSLLIAFILNLIILPGYIIDITLNKPINFYAFFFALYFVLPSLFSFYDKSISNENLSLISFFYLFSFFSFYLGIKKSKIKEIPFLRDKYFSRNEGRALLLICIILIIAIIYYYYWRISENIFFNHAYMYDQRTDLASSIRDVFIQSAQLPLIILLGLLTKVNDNKIAHQGKLLLFSYSIGITFIYTLSSQTRPAITALILLVVSVSFYKHYQLKLVKSFVILFLSIFIVTAIQAQRIALKEKLIMSSNQLSTALDFIINGTLSTISENNYDKSIIRSRAEGSVLFLSDIIDKFDEGYSPLFGKSTLIGLSGIIPRFIYPEKPIVTSPQLVVKGLLNMPLIDDALTMVNQFYVEFGTIGLFLGFLIFGFLMGKYFNYLQGKNSIGPFIFFSFFICQVIQMEQEFVIALLGFIRNSVIIYFIFLILKFIYGVKNKYVFTQ